jgi:hypothetical protein
LLHPLVVPSECCRPTGFYPGHRQSNRSREPALKDAPEDIRAPGIRRLLPRIRLQPPQFAVALAWNLAIDHAGGSNRDTLQEIADTLADALRHAPEEQRTTATYRTLAELAQYDQISVSLDDPRYLAAMRALDSEDRRRHDANFSLPDLSGKNWSLRALRGKAKRTRIL